MGNSNSFTQYYTGFNHNTTSPVSEKIHIGNSAYKVRYFTDTIFSGNVGKIVSCCDVRLTKLCHLELPNAVITSRLEILTQYTNSTTPFICDECGDYKVYYKKCS
ncbi:hypothetical protein F-liban_80 [Faustovirus]|nr:hypothetical protein F-liban_80 [Faustovirus]